MASACAAKTVTDTSYEADAQDEFAAFINRKLTVKGSFQVPGGPNAHELDCDFVVGGDGTPGSRYHVVALAPHLGGYDHGYYGDRQDWIREHLAAAAQEDPRKPIFLLTHGRSTWRARRTAFGTRPRGWRRPAARAS
ncbi:hypothetical protein I3I95_11110 [bacterium]|nr:hypothetical protein [bacterium]